MIGIYQLNFSSGDTYIGKSVNIARRLQFHAASRGKGSPKLLKAYSLYEYLGHTVLEECDELVLGEREAYYITTLKPSLNVLPGGEGMSGLNHPRCKYSEEQIKEVVHLYSNSFSTPKQISDITGVASSTVHDIIKGRSHTWATKHLDLLAIKDERALVTNVTLYDSSNNKYTVPKGSYTTFELEHGLSQGSITRLLNSQTGQSIYGFSLYPYNTDKYHLKSDEGLSIEVSFEQAKQILNELDLSLYSKKRILEGYTSKGFRLFKSQTTQQLVQN